MRLRIDERLVAKAKPACFRGVKKIKKVLRTTLAIRQMRAILRGVHVSWRE
jgi:hypothetical protein